MDIKEAQDVLDKRNGHFYILEFNGMRDKSKVMCSHCGSILNVSIDSLLRKDNSFYGCTVCNKFSARNKLLNNNLEYIRRIDGKTVEVKCQCCGNIYSGIYQDFTSKKYICKYCDDDIRLSKIINNQQLYSVSTVKHTITEWNMKCLIETNSLDWFYCLGLFMSDGNFRKETNRLRLSLKDADVIQNVSEILGCDIKNGIIDICNNAVKDTIERYSISDIKTYEPCNIKSIAGKEMIAFIIGFIDGDGSICFRSDTKKPRITIKLHSSWYDNLLYMSKELYMYFGLEKYPKPTYVVVNDKKYATIYFSNQIIISKLYEYINENSLSVMKRKWNRIGGDYQ